MTFSALEVPFTFESCSYFLKHKKKSCKLGVKPCSTSYHLTNFCGRLRCQARLALSHRDRNLSSVCSGKGPYDMAQCHDYLDIKMVGVETNPECSYINSTCHLLTDNTGSSSFWDYIACSWWLPNKIKVKGGNKKRKVTCGGKLQTSVT